MWSGKENWTSVTKQQFLLHVPTIETHSRYNLWDEILWSRRADFRFIDYEFAFPITKIKLHSLFHTFGTVVSTSELFKIRPSHPIKSNETTSCSWGNNCWLCYPDNSSKSQQYQWIEHICHREHRLDSGLDLYTWSGIHYYFDMLSDCWEISKFYCEISREALSQR